MLLFSDMLNLLVRYASPSGPMCLRCLMLTLSGPVELLFLLCFITTLDLYYNKYCVGCLQFECVPVYVSVCFVCFMFDCVGELVNCLLNAFAICVGKVSVFSLKGN